MKEEYVVECPLVIDLSKLSYGTLHMIGSDYGIEGNTIECVEDLENYVEKVVDMLEKETDNFFKQVEDFLMKEGKELN